MALEQSNPNIMPAVGDKLKVASSLANALIASLNFGPMRYVIDDATYVLNTYETTASCAKQGCAEQGFIVGALGDVAEVALIATVWRCCQVRFLEALLSD